jgi:DNA-binding NtrC family response regulator
MTDLMAYFLNRFSADLKKPVKGFAGDVTDAFMRYSWPGNIRELSNAVERAVVLCEGDTITLADLPCVFDKVGTAPPELSRPLLTYKEAVDESKREVIAAALAYRNGNQSRAAEILDLERTHLSRLMKQLGLRQ